MLRREFDLLLGRNGVPRPVLAAGNTWYRGTKAKNTVTSIQILDAYTPTGAEDEQWNADVGGTGAVRCYVLGDRLIMAGNGYGKLFANADSSYLFSGATTQTRFSAVTKITGAELLDVSETVSLESAFGYCESLTGVDVSGWDTSRVESMYLMFNRCLSLQSLDVSSWDTGRVTTMVGLFQMCVSLKTLELSGWNLSRVTDTRVMFGSAAAYGNMQLVSLGDVSRWDTACVTTMEGMFQRCADLTALPVAAWNVGAVKSLKNVFRSCSSLRSLDLSGWDTTACEKMEYLFYDMTGLEQITLGEAFDFAGIGSTAAVLPTPAGGLWYTADGSAYAPAAVPDRTAATYYAYDPTKREE